MRRGQRTEKGESRYGGMKERKWGGQRIARYLDELDLDPLWNVCKLVGIGCESKQAMKAAWRGDLLAAQVAAAGCPPVAHSIARGDGRWARGEG